MFVKDNKYSIGITFLRCFLCFTIVKNISFYLPMSEYLFGLEGIFPYENYIELLNFYKLNFLRLPFHIYNFSFAFLLLTMVFSVMYMFGVLGRFSGIVVLYCLFMLKLRNGFILDGSDNVIQVILPFLILADNLQYFRYFELQKVTILKSFLSQYSQIFTYALMVQVCFVYFFTGLAKQEGELWRNGTAVYYTMRVQDFMATNLNVTLTKNHYFVVLSTYLTLFWELAFPFLIWFRKTKFYIIFLGIIIHLGIWVFMRIDNFSWVMIATYFVFITNDEYKSIYENIKQKLFSLNKKIA